jgi:hypothetical protein
MLDWAVRDVPAERALTASETHRLARVLTPPPNTLNSRSYFLTKIAGLGRDLARASDWPPGTFVIWRGLSRFRDAEIEASILPRLG